LTDTGSYRLQRIKLLKEKCNLEIWMRLVQDRNSREVLQTARKFLSFKRGGNVITYLRAMSSSRKMFQITYIP
jgi:hypothetical protein